MKRDLKEGKQSSTCGKSSPSIPAPCQGAQTLVDGLADDDWEALSFCLMGVGGEFVELVGPTGSHQIYEDLYAGCENSV